MLRKLATGLIVLAVFVGVVVAFRWAHDTYGPGIALSAMAALISLAAVVLARFRQQANYGPASSWYPRLDDDD